MTEITLQNGSKFQIYSIQFKGKIIDSNGTESGGESTYSFTETEVNALNQAVPLQAAYNAIFPQAQTETQESNLENNTINQG